MNKERPKSQKEIDFIREPLYDAVHIYKSADTIGGIGDNAAIVLKKRGFEKAFHLIGQYLVLDMDEQLFKKWLTDLLEEENIKVQDKYLDSVYRSISEWCGAHWF